MRPSTLLLDQQLFYLYLLTFPITFKHTSRQVDGVNRIGDTITCSGLGVSPSFYWSVTSESDMSPPTVPKVASGSNTLKFDNSWVGHIYTLKCTGMNLVAGSTG